MKANFIYLLDWDGGPVKIGMTSDVARRIAGIQQSHPHELRLIRSWRRPNGDALKVERLAHRVLRAHQARGEWFACHPTEAVKAVELAIHIADTGDESEAPWRRDYEVLEAVTNAIMEKRVTEQDAYAEFLAWASDPDQVDAEVEKWNRKRAKMSAKEGQNAE